MYLVSPLQEVQYVFSVFTVTGSRWSRSWYRSRYRSPTLEEGSSSPGLSAHGRRALALYQIDHENGVDPSRGAGCTTYQSSGHFDAVLATSVPPQSDQDLAPPPSLLPGLRSHSQELPATVRWAQPRARARVSLMATEPGCWAGVTALASTMTGAGCNGPGLGPGAGGGSHTRAGCTHHPQGTVTIRPGVLATIMEVPFAMGAGSTGRAPVPVPSP